MKNIKIYYTNAMLGYDEFASALFLHKLQFDNEKESVFSFVLTEKWANFLIGCTFIICDDHFGEDEFILEDTDFNNRITIEQKNLLNSIKISDIFTYIHLYNVENELLTLDEILDFSGTGIKPSTENDEIIGWLLSQVENRIYRKHK
jgi:hypothetical protein